MKVSDSQSQTNTDGSTTYVPMYECSVIRGAAKATTGSAYAATTAATTAILPSSPDDNLRTCVENPSRYE